MDRISAAGNLTIEVKPERWRLLVNGNSQERVLLEAAMGQPLRYIPTFAAKRRLPNTGILPVEEIQRVVLGWSNQDESWHLGLLLESELANVRGSRWCEIARWPDPDLHVFGPIASQAGRSLARTLTRPFNLVEPRQEERPAPEPVMPPLRELPFEFEMWQFERQGDSLRFVRSPQWARARVFRIIWYALLIAVYIVLSLTTLSGIIALPKPDFLPYLGLGVAALMGIIILYLIYQLLTQPNRIYIDSETQSIRARRNDTERWRIDPVALDSIYVSQVMSRKKDKHIVYHGEINARLQDGSFIPLLIEHQPIDDLRTPLNSDDTEGVATLTTFNGYTDLQMTGLWIAQALRVPCWYDHRKK